MTVHPLEPLAADEISRAVEILRAKEDHVEQSMLIARVVLDEPTKDELAGSSVERRAAITIVPGPGADLVEAVVSLTNEAVTSCVEVHDVRRRAVPGQDDDELRGPRRVLLDMDLAGRDVDEVAGDGIERRLGPGRAERESSEPREDVDRRLARPVVVDAGPAAGLRRGEGVPRVVEGAAGRDAQRRAAAGHVATRGRLTADRVISSERQYRA